MKFVNNSDIDILSNYYDPKNPLGLLVKNATIVEKPEIIEASNQYLKDNIEIYQNDSLNLCTFSNVIIDGHQFFNIKLLLLHKSQEKPIINPIGKIAGINTINTINQADEIETPFLKDFLHGSILIHILRFLFYFIAFIVIILIIVIPLSTLSDSLSKKKRKANVKKYKEITQIENDKVFNILFDLYIEHSEEFLFKLRTLIKYDKKRLNRNATQYIVSLKDGNNSSEQFSLHNQKYLLNLLYKQGIIDLTDNKLSVKDSFRIEFESFCNYIKLPEYNRHILLNQKVINIQE